MSESGPSIAVHSNPIWRERSNFIFRAALPENGSGRSFEQLWARRLTENTFELCCIPFFLYELSLGDIVSTTSDGEYVMGGVVARSGRSTYRAWFGESEFSQRDFEVEVTRRGGLVERSSANLLAIDAAETASAESVVHSLTELHNSGHLVFEIGSQGREAERAN